MAIIKQMNRNKNVKNVKARKMKDGIFAIWQIMINPITNW